MKTVKKVLITGAAGNLGKAALQKFISAGYQVLAVVSPGKKSTITIAGAEVFEADLTNEASAQALIQTILSNYGNLDAALLLVGGYTYGPLADADLATVKKMFTLNFDTAYTMARAVFNAMIAQPEGGRIVLVGARPAIQAADGKRNIAYALSKSLIFKLAELLNAEGKGRNVVTSVIVPSTIDTPENRKAMPNAKTTDWVTPETIAEAMAWLVSDNASALREPVLKLYSNA